MWAICLTKIVDCFFGDVVLILFAISVLSLVKKMFFFVARTTQ